MLIKSACYAYAFYSIFMFFTEFKSAVEQFLFNNSKIVQLWEICCLRRTP